MNRLLWVTFQLHEICSQTSDYNIRKAIGNLPKGITETYNRAIDRIINLGKDDIAQDAFVWVICGRRPLTLDELREAMSIKIGQTHSLPERQVNGIHRLTSWCANLVEVDEEEQTVRLVHHTVLQFLLSEDLDSRFIWLPKDLKAADCYLGEICVTYLNFSDFETAVAQRPRTPPPPPISPKGLAATAMGSRWRSLPSSVLAEGLKSNTATQASMEKSISILLSSKRTNAKANHKTFMPGYPFLKYASKEWIWHSRNFEFDQKTAGMWKRLVMEPHSLVQFPWSCEDSTADYNCILNWACHEHHYTLLAMLLNGKQSTEDLNIWAEVVLRRAFLTLDARLFHLCSRYGRLFQGVEFHIWSNEFSTFASLLQAGSWPHVAVEGKELGQVLWEAARLGYNEVVGRLLSGRVDPDSQGLYLGRMYGVSDFPGRGRPMSAVEVAAMNNHLETVKVLASAGADMNPVNRSSGILRRGPVDYALMRGNSEMAAIIRAAIERREASNAIPSLDS